MRDFFNRIGGAIARFMYGRNGSDQLNMALLVVYLFVWVLELFFSRVRLVMGLLNLVSLVLIVVVFFRLFSKNLPKRRAENERFLAWWYPMKNRVSGAAARRKDKEHKYFTCKQCGTICRVPAGKGKIEITCPKCGGKIVGKS